MKRDAVAGRCASGRLLPGTNPVLLRTLDALHIALAFSGTATHRVTFDRRMAEAAAQAGLNVIEL